MPDPTPAPGGGEPPDQPPSRPPATGVDPSDGGPAVTVALGGQVIGDLGAARTDAALVVAMLLRGGRVGEWLAEQGVSRAEVEAEFGATDWPA
jgi:hypothetical protein